MMRLKSPGVLILTGMVLFSFSSRSAGELSSEDHEDIINAASSWNLYKIQGYVDRGVDLQSYPEIFHAAALAIRLSRGIDTEDLKVDPLNEWVGAAGLRHPIGGDAFGSVELIEAAISVFQFFLNNGVDVNVRNKGATPLHTALVSDVLLTGSRIDIREEFDFKAADLIVALIYVGADIHQTNSKSGQTPFHFAIDHGQIREAEILFLHGANPNTTDSWGNNGLHSLFLNRKKIPEEWVVKTAKAFIDLGGDICMRNKGGHTPVTLALAGDLSYEIKDRLMEIFLSARPSCHLQRGSED